ncbi:polyphosphate kinase 2 [Cocleimonas flava]|uniref:ADP/GDP-polyphosphate phosphotransferase n=1 Tax=Cocleimonas flava TaxID=634765 RepID=A0A4R1EQC4_9GAMM|nr:polyphosphate kinase 2 [Cocleimonas flava]TCJ83283.1 polyphosphate kinase 2 [Cocleimonas flava]
MSTNNDSNNEKIVDLKGDSMKANDHDDNTIENRNAEGADIDSLDTTNELEQQIIDLQQQIEELTKDHSKAEKKYKIEKTLKPFQAELIALQKYLEDTNKRMIILFEGRDASGKGGTIRRVTRYMNEKHYRLVALGKPTKEQRSQWYFHRYVEQFPHGGELVLFDRSWYNRSMVEPVLGFCTPEEHKTFMKGVVGFEKDLVRQGTILVKLYFSVTKDEQAKRFERRKTDPLRQWKLSEVDIQAQEHWDEFTNAKYEMLKRSHTSAAPWVIVRSNDKNAARLNTLKVILNSVPYKRSNPDLDYIPDPDIVVSGAREIETMEADRLKKGKFKA